MATGPARSNDACCSALEAALHAEEFEPTITVDEDGVLCLTIGITDIEEDEPTLVLEPMIYCPFCGTRLQTVEEVEAKSGGSEDEDAG